MVCNPNSAALSAPGPWLPGRWRPMAAVSACLPSSMTAWVTCPGPSPATAVTLASADHCRRVTTGPKPSPAEASANRS